MLKVKRGLFLFKLKIHCMVGRKLNFTSNDQNTNHFFGKPENSLTGENVKFFMFQQNKEKANIYNKQTNWHVSEICLLAMYNLPSMHFISFTCSVGTTKYRQSKRKL